MEMQICERLYVWLLVLYCVMLNNLSLHENVNLSLHELIEVEQYVWIVGEVRVILSYLKWFEDAIKWALVIRYKTLVMSMFYIWVLLHT